MNSSICFVSAGANWSTSRNVSTCRSGITRRCVSAFGLMSRIATTPGPVQTCSPSRYSRQKRQSSGSEDSLLGDLSCADANELADVPVDEPRRVVVAVTAPRPVDQDEVFAPDLRAPSCDACRLGRRTHACAPLFLHLRRNGIACFRHRAGTRRVWENVHLRDPGFRHDGKRVAERPLVLAREADDDVRRQVELVLERSDPLAVLARAVAPRHIAQDAVVARLQRDMQVLGDRGRLTQRSNERVIDVVDLDRREPETREARRGGGVPDELRQAVTERTVPIAAEVDPGEHDLTVTLRNASVDLAQNRFGGAAPRLPP